MVVPKTCENFSRLYEVHPKFYSVVVWKRVCFSPPLWLWGGGHNRHERLVAKVVASTVSILCITRHEQHVNIAMNFSFLCLVGSHRTSWGYTCGEFFLVEKKGFFRGDQKELDDGALHTHHTLIGGSCFACAHIWWTGNCSQPTGRRSVQQTGGDQPTP